MKQWSWLSKTHITQRKKKKDFGILDDLDSLSINKSLTILKGHMLS